MTIDIDFQPQIAQPSSGPEPSLRDLMGEQNYAVTLDNVGDVAFDLYNAYYCDALRLYPGHPEAMHYAGLYRDAVLRHIGSC